MKQCIFYACYLSIHGTVKPNSDLLLWLYTKVFLVLSIIITLVAEGAPSKCYNPKNNWVRNFVQNRTFTPSSFEIIVSLSIFITDLLYSRILYSFIYMETSLKKKCCTKTHLTKTPRTAYAIYCTWLLHTICIKPVFFDSNFMVYNFKGAMALWLRCLLLVPKIVGSSPIRVTTMFLHKKPVLVGSRKRTGEWFKISC